MSMNKSSSEINEQIKDAIDISDVIGSYITVHKAGKDYKAVCPFHDDSNPSLSISTSKKIFNCFPCGTKGDSITFVMLYEKLSYPQAVQRMIEKFNISVEGFKITEESKSSKKAKVLYKINKIAADNYFVNLFSDNGKAAQKYLKTRGIETDLINKFEIGYVSENDNNLIEVLRKNFSLDEIRESNLFIESGSKFIPFFRERIVFPIKDVEGNVLGFSGRIFDKGKDKEKIKYLNSKDNQIFKKSEITYNLNNSKNVISKKDEAIIVEGYMDVIALDRVGIQNTVAIMGVAFTSGHVELISKFTKNITFMLDSDNAGMNAMLSIISDLESKSKNYGGLKLRFVHINDSKDPDDFVTKFGKDETIKLIENKKTSSMFTMDYFESINDLNTADGKVAFKNAMFVSVSKVNNLTDRKLLLQEIAFKISIDIETLVQDFENQYSRTAPKHLEKSEFSEAFNPPELFEPQKYSGFEIQEVFQNPMDYVSKTSVTIQDLLKNLDWTAAYLKSQELLIAAMIRNPALGYEKIKKAQVLFFTKHHTDIIKTILKIYKNSNYNDDDLDLIISKVKEYKKEYLIPIIEGIYSGIDIFFKKEKIVKKLKISSKVIDDSISTLELRRINKDIFTYQDTLVNAKSKQEATTLLENVNLLLKKREKHIKKMKG
ncbi:DNA primase [Spiroplasma sp. TIUS-1]|uniref:DNA primase n=1 Tax=Spiroplasma sp. TIUS-1 TaxID=216963 RepID=UPI001397C9CE|nr:DNA primase [Spiroplasma sp. TIUS-1]QHX35966.1 DNA primase [Spiroplasma sp. TIUS-1]